MARPVKASDFVTSYQYEQAKKQARKGDIGRRSGRRGTQAWGIWADKE
jgi:hypothetical protein